MSNIITRGFKGVWKIITRGYGSTLTFKICRTDTNKFICQDLTVSGFLSQKTAANDGFLCQKIKAEG